MAIFCLIFNVGPCLAGVLSETKTYALSLFLSVLPSSEGTAVTEHTHRELRLPVTGHDGGAIPEAKWPPGMLFRLGLPSKGR